MLLSSRQHCPGTLFCDTTILVINEGNSTQLCSFGGQGHLGGLTASGTTGTWPKARALLATTVRAALWYHETSPLTLSFFLNSKMKPYATNQVEPGLAEALRLMAAVCHQLTANTEDEAVLTIYWGNQLLYVLWMAIYWEMCCPPRQRLEWIYSLQYQTEAQQNKSNLFPTSGKTWRCAQVMWIQFLSFKF